jgi:hypothetical protein
MNEIKSNETTLKHITRTIDEVMRLHKITHYNSSLLNIPELFKMLNADHNNEVAQLRNGLDYADKANRVLKDQNADLFYAKEKADAEVARLTDILQLVETINEKLSPWDSNPSRRDPCVWCGNSSHTEECNYMRLVGILEEFGGGEG